MRSAKYNSLSRPWGIAALIGFIGCVFAANYFVTHVGTAPAFPGGPHTVTILGLTAPSGVLIVGISFTLRDLAQMALGKWHILIAIAIGVVLSYLVAPSLALASAVAFGVSETADWAVYTPLAERGERGWWAGLIASNTVGAAIDSVLFLWIAFGWVNGVEGFFAAQFWLKLLMTVPAIILLMPWRVAHYRRLHASLNATAV